MKYTYPIKKLVVFSQWSRKSYAVFASLGKIIKIARVSVDISDKALIKNTVLTRSLNEILSFKKKLIDLLEELRQAEGIPDAFITQLVLLMNCFILFTSVQKEGKPARHVPFKNQSPCFI